LTTEKVTKLWPQSENEHQQGFNNSWSSILQNPRALQHQPIIEAFTAIRGNVVGENFATINNECQWIVNAFSSCK
jgi:hypothetical protein